MRLKTLHTYLTRQILASLLMTVMVFTVVLLLGNALKDVLPLLLSGQVRFGLVAQVVGTLIPFAWVYALPMGMLTATLLIFGRFSADQELTAVRASGISLLSLVSPILLLSLALCALCALINMEVGPRSRTLFKNLQNRLTAELATAYLPEGRFIQDFDGYIFYAGKNRKGNLEDVIVFRLADDTTLRAPHGKLEVDATGTKFNITLYDCRWISTGQGEPVGTMEEFPIETSRSGNKNGQEKPGIDNMSFTQLCQEQKELERLLNWPVSRKLTREQLRQWKQTWEKQLKENASRILFHKNRQVAFSFACFSFTLLGIPLGIRVHRRETNIGIAIALLLVALYYGFILVGQALETRPEFASYVVVWLPNFLFQTVGAVLLWRANRY